jgi:hypothetical protein
MQHFVVNKWLNFHINKIIEAGVTTKLVGTSYSGRSYDQLCCNAVTTNFVVTPLRRSSLERPTLSTVKVGWDEDYFLQLPSPDKGPFPPYKYQDVKKHILSVKSCLFLNLLFSVKKAAFLSKYWSLCKESYWNQLPCLSCFLQTFCWIPVFWITEQVKTLAKNCGQYKHSYFLLSVNTVRNVFIIFCNLGSSSFASGFVKLG